MKISALFVLAFGLTCANVYAEDNQMQSSQSLTSTTTDTSTTTSMTQSPEVKNQMEGAAFLAANKSKPGVVTLADGLQYKILKEGTGPMPAANDTVTVNYSGRFINGVEFDSSEKHGQPISFPVTGVIPGWVEALQMMKVGSTWELYVPAALAYGDRGMPPVIGPNQTLIFNVTLLAVKKSS